MKNTKILSHFLISAIIFCVLQLFLMTSAQANQAEVVNVKIIILGEGKYRIDATLKHADTGWKHYANAWLVFDESGKELGARVLHHPHVNEQPFTRSLTVSIPAGVKKVTIRAKDSLHGLNDKGMTVDVPLS